MPITNEKSVVYASIPKVEDRWASTASGSINYTEVD